MEIQLETILDALEKAGPDTRAYLSLKTGNVETCQEDEFGEYTDGVCYPESNPDYILLPGQLEIDEYHMMRSFALGTADPRKKESLLKALLEPGAYQAFEQTLQKTGMDNAWKRYKKKRYYEIASSFCKEHHIHYAEKQKIFKADRRNLETLTRLRITQLETRGFLVREELRQEIHDFFEKSLQSRKIHALIGMEGRQPRCCACLLIHEYIPSAYNPRGKVGYISCIYLENEKYSRLLQELIAKLEKTAVYFGCTTLCLEKTDSLEPLIRCMGYIQDEDWMVKKVSNEQ